MSSSYADGGVLSTVEDLCRYGTAMIDSFQGRPGAVLSEDTMRRLWTVEASTGEYRGKGTEYYGLGWFLADTETFAFMPNHGGIVFGLHSILLVYPQERTAVAIIAQADIPGRFELSSDLVNIFLDSNY